MAKRIHREMWLLYQNMLNIDAAEHVGSVAASNSASDFCIFSY